MDVELPDTADDLRWLEVLARGLSIRDGALSPMLDAILEKAVQTVTPAGDAGLILVTRSALIPQGATGTAPDVLDRLQVELGDGPCVQTARQQSSTSLANMATESRWPRFVARARELGVGSMLCVPLWVDERTLGTLSLYATSPEAFSDPDERVAALFATLSAIALLGAQRADQLKRAAANRDVIGQAKGILMERHRITADEAFTRLSQASQRLGAKLLRVAEDLVATGELPGG